MAVDGFLYNSPESFSCGLCQYDSFDYKCPFFCSMKSTRNQDKLPRSSSIDSLVDVVWNNESETNLVTLPKLLMVQETSSRRESLLSPRRTKQSRGINCKISLPSKLSLRSLMSKHRFDYVKYWYEKWTLVHTKKIVVHFLVLRQIKVECFKEFTSHRKSFHEFFSVHLWIIQAQKVETEENSWRFFAEAHA